MESLMQSWNPYWKYFPWKAWTSPYERFQVLPSFVVGEFFFIFAAILLFFHAAKNGRVYITLWFSSLITGSANDAFFMALPIVDNFWQSQACIMLTPRMPLYIPCVYIVFMYSSIVGAWRFKLPILAQACLAGFMGEMIYSPYDITGAKFLWWTWHDTDAPIRDRLFGAPIGSSTWVITFSCSFHLIWRLLLTDEQISKGSGLSFFGGLGKVIISGLFSTPLMMVQMALLQLVSGDSQGLPTMRSLMACIIVYLMVIYFWPLNKKDRKNLLHQSQPKVDQVVRTLLTLHFLFFVVNMMISVPENHMSTGVHQTVGDCKEYGTDMAGHKRQVFLCQENFDEDFNFDCPQFKEHKKKLVYYGTHWYTVCSNPHTNKFQYVMAVSALALLGTFTYRLAFASQENKLSKKKE